MLPDCFLCDNLKCAGWVVVEFGKHIFSDSLRLDYLSGSEVFTVTDEMIDFYINTPRPRPDGRHFPDDFFTYIFLNEN